jgi:hypothetical protein
LTFRLFVIYLKYKGYKSFIFGGLPIMPHKDSHKEFSEMHEEHSLFDSYFDESYRDEFREMDKHEILVKICDILGSCPSNFSSAEKIFEAVKLEMAQYVIHHEYCKDNAVKSKLLLWFDAKLNPHHADKCKMFYENFFK